MNVKTKPPTIDEIKAQYPDWAFHQLSVPLWKHRGGYASVELRREGWVASLSQAFGLPDEHGNYPRMVLPLGPFEAPEQAMRAADDAGWTIVTQ